jgi:hypothetical protein
MPTQQWQLLVKEEKKEKQKHYLYDKENRLKSHKEPMNMVMVV